MAQFGVTTLKICKAALYDEAVRRIHAVNQRPDGVRLSVGALGSISSYRLASLKRDVLCPSAIIPKGTLVLVDNHSSKEWTYIMALMPVDEVRYDSNEYEPRDIIYTGLSLNQTIDRFIFLE